MPSSNLKTPVIYIAGGKNCRVFDLEIKNIDIKVRERTLIYFQVLSYLEI